MNWLHNRHLPHNSQERPPIRVKVRVRVRVSVHFPHESQVSPRIFHEFVELRFDPSRRQIQESESWEAADKVFGTLIIEASN